VIQQPPLRRFSFFSGAKKNGMRQAFCYVTRIVITPALIAHVETNPLVARLSLDLTELRHLEVEQKISVVDPHRSDFNPERAKGQAEPRLGSSRPPAHHRTQQCS
jgi:hypothetical protein